MSNLPGAAVPSAGYDLLASFVLGTSQYYLVGRDGGVTQGQARAEAARMGGELASIETAAENAGVFGLINQFDSAWDYAGFSRQLGPWIGAERQPGGGFAWDSGAAFGYTAWASGEPNDYTGTETAVHYLSKTFFGRESTWNDIQPSGVWPAFGTGQVSSFLVESTVLVDAPPKTTQQIFKTEGQLGFLAQLALAAYHLDDREVARAVVNDRNPRGDDAFDGVAGSMDGNDFDALSRHIKLLSWQQMEEDLAIADTSAATPLFPTTGLDGGIYTNENAAALVGRSSDALFVAFRGTNDNATVNNGALSVVRSNSPDKAHWIGKGDHFDLFAPLVDAIKTYVANPHTGIETIHVIGHSLGGGMVEALTSDWSDARVVATTFASSGYGFDFASDPRITNFWFEDDPILSASWSADNDGDKNIVHHGLRIGIDIDDNLPLHSSKLYADVMRFMVENSVDTDDVRAFRGVDFDDIHLRVTVMDEDLGFFTVGAQADRIRGGRADDMILGGAASDTLQGRGGRDYLDGGTHSDTIVGGLGRDFILGGAGFDTMTGGFGKDQFIFRSHLDFNASRGLSKTDLITDFSSGRIGRDVIVLREIDAQSGVRGNQAFTFIDDQAFSGQRGELRFEQRAAQTLVQGDLNGDGVADFTLRLTGLHDLTADHFAL